MYSSRATVTRHGDGAEPHQHSHNYRIFSVAVSDAVRFFSRVDRNHQYLQPVTTETVRYRVDFSRGLHAQLNRLMRIDNHGNRPMYPWRGLVYAWINACNFSGSLYVIGAVCSYAIMIGCDGKTPSVPNTSTDRPFSTDDPLSGVPVSIDVSNNNRPPTNIEKLAVLSDPALDAWDTEVLYQHVTKQLAALRTLIEHPEEITRARVSPLITENFTCDPFLPIDLREVFNGPTMVVRRAAALDRSGRNADLQSGTSGFVKAFQDMASRLGATGRIRAAFKIFRIEKSGESIITQILFEASRRDTDHNVQLNATWHVNWTLSDKPLLQTIDVEHYEEVTLTATNGSLFSDCTARVMRDTLSYQ